MSKLGFGVYEALLTGTGLGTGYAAGVVYGTVKDLMLNQLSTMVSSGDIYKGLAKAVEYGTTLGPDAAVITAAVTLFLGVELKHAVFGSGASMTERLFGKKEGK